MPGPSEPVSLNDPHSEDEEHYHDQARPGGARPPPDTVQKVNPQTHSGKAPTKPAHDGKTGGAGK
ncbi:hypothetical protein O9Z70_11010 [Devosia sp. YIM 151766]|uniref:hypothetical protein n=1 Tax=Devosia sp. YIM 151766 TaxID=3017325 RepID=UPI00255CB80E|nr:hypothetical protein [Devosia sp. YIM 151766]WIY52009.1 hypothetical protein O9Z70_11010 [Devosia sp. YIM 151766]